MDLIPQFRELIEYLEKIKLSVIKESDFDYKSQDARMVALDSLQVSISAVGMWIHCYYSLADFHTKEGQFNKDSFLNSLGSGLNIEQTEEEMFKPLKLGFITLAHFKFDNLFSNILRDLGALPQNLGYWNLTNEIFKQCSMPQQGEEKDILTAFAYLRNSLHNNGMHRRGRDLIITIDGFEFKFTANSRVECASWGHVVVLLRANIRIMERILQSDKVQSIRTEIRDDFASGA
jgi:hypothetical protein